MWIRWHTDRLYTYARARRRAREDARPRTMARETEDEKARETEDEKARAERELLALVRGELRERIPKEMLRAMDASDGVEGGDAQGKGGARDGTEVIAPRALVALFERPRASSENESESESGSGSESEGDFCAEASDGTYETVAGVAYGAKIEIRRWIGNADECDEDGEGENGGSDDDGALDSDSENAYGGYASSSSEDIVKRMSRLRSRPMGRCERIELADDNTPHTGNIRVFRVSADGKWFVTAGDDKLVKLWSTEGWKCTRTVACGKKVSSACFTPDSQHFIFADKFGEIFACEVGSDKEPVLMLGHCSTIITDVVCMEGGKSGYLLTSDRENKTRVSVLPKSETRTAFNGSAPEIQSFCYGHSQYVSCVRPIVQPESRKKRWGTHKDCLITGSGDASLRMWDAATGQETDPLAVIQFHFGEICDIATRAEGTHISVAIEEKKELAVVHLTSFKSVPKLFLVGFGPPWAECAHSIQFDRNMILWGAGVRKNEDGSQTAVFMREGTIIDDLSVTLSAEESAGTTYYSQLRKREFSEQERLARKQHRKDMQIKEVREARKRKAESAAVEEETS